MFCIRSNRKSKFKLFIKIVIVELKVFEMGKWEIQKIVKLKM